MGLPLCCRRAAARCSLSALSRSAVVGSRSYKDAVKEVSCGEQLSFGAASSPLLCFLADLLQLMASLDLMSRLSSKLKSCKDSFLFFEPICKISKSSMWQTDGFVIFLVSSLYWDTSSIVFLIFSIATSAAAL